MNYNVCLYYVNDNVYLYYVNFAIKSTTLTSVLFQDVAAIFNKISMTSWEEKTPKMGPNIYKF